MRPRAYLIAALAALLIAAPLRGEDEAAPEGAEYYAEYATEDLEQDPGVVALSGEIVIRRGDFELSVPDGGVVLWVDPEGWRGFRSGMGESLEAGGEGEAAEGENGAPAPEDVLGPVIHELYAEGGVTLRRGGQVVRAERLFYNFAANRAVIFKAEVLYEYLYGSDGFPVPLFVRADRLYQVAEDEFRAAPARATTSMFGKPQYELTVSEVVIRRDGAAYDVFGEGNVLRLGDVPVFWSPWFSANTTSGLEPLRDLSVGQSSRYGAYVEVGLGGTIRFADGDPWGRWRLEPVYRHRRGPGIGGDLTWKQPDYRGRLRAFYQYDGKSHDQVTDYEIPDRNRGRVRFQHRHVLFPDLFGGRLEAIGELSHLCDRGFLTEYWTNEALQGKEQETVAYLNWTSGPLAASATGRWQLNRFQTVTEYRPRANADLIATPLALNAFRTGVDVYFSGEAEAANLYRAWDPETGMRGVSVDRYTARGALALPFSLGPLRVDPEVGYGATGYHGELRDDRLDAFASVRVGTDLFRVFPEVECGLLDLQGLRHVVDVSAGWVNRFSVTDPSEELVVQDYADQLDELHAVDLRVRNRLETKRGGEILDWVDLELRAVYFPEVHEARPSPLGFREEYRLGIPALLLAEEEKFRHIERKGFGPITGRLAAAASREVTLLADAWYECETGHFETWSAGARYDAAPDLAFFLGHRAIHGDSSIMTGWIEFRATERWELRLYQQTDFKDDDGLASGLLIRRYFPDFVFELDLRYNTQRNDTSVSFSVRPRLWYESRRQRDRDLMDYRGMRRSLTR